MDELRPATTGDAPAIAKIMQDWLDTTAWIPDLHTLEQTVSFCRRVLIESYETTVEGTPATGFIAIEPDRSIAALYVAPTGQGTGGRLLRHAQSRYPDLKLWVFQKNTGAIRFYERHGFTETRRTDGAHNDEKLPDVLMSWQA